MLKKVDLITDAQQAQRDHHLKHSRVIRRNRQKRGLTAPIPVA